MSSAIVYNKLTDHINKANYRLEAPAYITKEHQAFTDSTLDRFYVPDKNHIVLTRLTIADMVDMVDKRIQFKILASEDIIEIYEFLSRYMLELSRYEKHNQKAADYMHLCRNFKNKLVHSINILANRGMVNAVRVRKEYESRAYLDAFLNK